MDLQRQKQRSEWDAEKRYGDTWVGGEDGPPPAEVLAQIPYLNPGSQN